MCKVEKFEEPQEPRNGSKPIYYYQDSKGCFICFSHYRDHGDYAKLNRGGKKLRIHRYTFTITKGEILPGLQIRHLCNNPSCINPDHLAVGTAMDNAQDRKKNKRVRKKSKRLNDEEKQTILCDTEHTIPELAEIYDVSYNTICKVRRDRNEKRYKKNAA